MKDDFIHSAISESSLSMLISAARRHVKHAVGSFAEPYGLNPYQCWMIMILRDRGPMSLSELAGRMWMDHPTTSRLVHALQENGLLMVQPDPTHGRKVLIGINPEKVVLADEIYEKAMKYRATLENGMTNEEKTVLHSALAKVITNLEEYLADGPERMAAKPAIRKVLAS